MLEELQKLSRHFLEIKNSAYRRYFIRTANLSHRMSLIMGPRGVGKTTSLVQILLDRVNNDLYSPKILYVQSDHFLVSSNSLYEIAEKFQMLGGKWIVFDEIHKVPNWSQELKSIYDTFPDLTVFGSGSSALEIHRGSHDLSRRAIVYHMQGMSFREYLELRYGIVLPSFDLKEICENHLRIAPQIIQELGKSELKIIPEFQRYLKVGYYPYFSEIKDESLYSLTLEQNVHTTIESDLSATHPQLTGVSIHKIKQLLSFIANAVPFTPNWSHILSTLEIGDLRTLKTYFSHLEEAGLIRSLSKASHKFNQLESPSKIYLDNPNLIYGISSNNPEIGTVRETFFFSQLNHSHKIRMPINGDFLVDDAYLFEVGGKNKKFNQIKEEKNSYLAIDEIETGTTNKLPLWLFGFLY